jgi:hypothetical protein
MDPVLIKAMQDAGWKQVLGLWMSPLYYFGGNRDGSLYVEHPRDLLMGSQWVRITVRDRHAREFRNLILTRAEFLMECRN